MKAFISKEEVGFEMFFEVSPNYVYEPTEGAGQDDAVAFSSGVVGAEVVDTAIETSVEEARAFALKILEICDVIEHTAPEDEVFYSFPISRADEAAFPKFENVEAARCYFKARYGDSYRIGNSEMIDGIRWYFDDVSGQPVQIDEKGFVHVVY